MKKLIAICLIFTLIIPLFSDYTFASTTGSETRIIKQELNSKDAEKVFTFNDLPKETTQIIEGSITFNGTGKFKSVSVDQSKRTVTVTILGEKTEVKEQIVYGLSNSLGEWFPANPGNAMCRYSNGLDWQVATIRQGDFAQLLDKYILSGGKAPTNPPYGIMKEIITASSPKIPSGVNWFDKLEKGEKVEASIVDMTSVKIAKAARSSIGTVVYPTKYDENNPQIGVRYKPTFMEVDPETDPRLRNIKPDNPAFLTGQAICKLYPASYEYYVTAKTKPTTGYSYNGTITIPYIKTTDAALLGNLTADPSSKKFEGQDVKVKLTLEANVLNLSDLGAIDYYQVYLRTDEGLDIVAGEKYPANGKGTFKQTYEFTIPKSVMNGKDEYTQIFKGRVRAEYKRSSKFIGPLDTGLLTASTYIYIEKTPPPPPPPALDKPVAIITADSEVKLGDDVYLGGGQSYDPDGEIVGYRWTLIDAMIEYPNEYDEATWEVWTWYNTLGPKRVILYVKDNDGLQDGAIHSLVVVEPTVEASISQSGTLKENRKVTFSESSDSPTRYPVIDAKTTWKVESYMGDIPASAIRVDSSLTGQRSIDVLFKQPGEYRVTLTVENKAGYTDTVSRIYTIKPDYAPEVDFTFQEKIYRDPALGNQATFTLKDLSYSTDGDSIVSRNWYVVYDANNDGIYNEAKVLFNSGNNTQVEYKTTKVGKYAFYLEVQEAFGQPTIEKFVTAADRRKSNTWQ